MAPLPIPQTDPKASYLASRAKIDAAVRRVLDGGWYILGDEVAAFEREFAGFIGAGHGIGVASGTDALVLGLKALGVGPGDTVVTVSHTAVATVAAIEIAGATPILVDVDPATFTMDPTDLQGVLERPGAPVKAVIPVHLYGCPAAIETICALAERHGAAVLEDVSQAHGATVGGRRLGRFGALGAFSLYPTKNLGAFGDGGVIVTESETIAERLKALREYGWRRRYVSDTAGFNSRLDELQAAILRVKLTRLEADNARRRAIAALYDQGLADLPLTRPTQAPGVAHVYHQYVVRLAERDRVKAALAERGVGSNIHYPLPVHLQPAYQGRVATGPSGLRETEALTPEVLSLPMYPQLDDAMAARVIEAIHEALGA